MRLHYKILGEGGGWVVMLHGWGGDHTHWLAVAEPLSRYCQVMLLDLPGFGQSPEPPSPWGTVDYATEVARLLSSEACSPAILIGHSFGGRIALRLAVDYPHLVTSLILIGATGVKRKRKFKTRVKILLAKGLKLVGDGLGGGVQSLCEQVRERLGSPDWRNATPVMRAIASRIINEDMTPLLPRVSSPTLLIWGQDDKETPLEMGKRLQQAIPNSTLVVIPQAGHFPHWEKRGEVLSHIWKFINLPTPW